MDGPLPHRQKPGYIIAELLNLTRGRCVQAIERISKETIMRCAGILARASPELVSRPWGLLSVAGRQLLFLRRHLPPQYLQIGRDAGVLRLLMERPREPAISGRKIATYAMAGSIHCSQDRLGLAVAVSRGGA